jgi:hypothetical protein
VNSVPRWRIAAGAVVLAALVFFVAIFAPVYWRNLQLQNFVSSLPQKVEQEKAAGRTPSDEDVRKWVLTRARDLNLPVDESEIRVFRSADGTSLRRIDVRYYVQVDLPGYTVNLHFYPGAGSR